MSIEHMAVVMNHSKAKGTARSVLIGIASHMGDGGAWPSMARLARYGNVDVRNAQRAVEKLQALGEIRVHVQQGGTHLTDDARRPNRYDVLVECPPWCDKTTQHRDQRHYQGQPGLWKTGAAESPPGGGIATPTPGGIATPTGGGSATRITPMNHQPEPRGSVVPQVQPARDLGPPCSECLLSRTECERRKATSGHAYTPTRKETA